MRFSARGFTLIELLVVIAIMAVIGIYTLSNYSSFGEDQNLKNAALDIINMAREAQANSTSNLKCVSEYGNIWTLTFPDDKTFQLKCSETATPRKETSLPVNITQLVLGNNSLKCPSPAVVNFAPLTGKIDLGDKDCTELTITLTNSKTGSTKVVKIENGGKIYVP